jgi:hypothetical protein
MFDLTPDPDRAAVPVDVARRGCDLLPLSPRRHRQPDPGAVREWIGLSLLKEA